MVMMELKDKRNAILLVGPTSSGKTPLGDLLQEQGLAGRSCRHFDFGAKFRAAASAESPPAPLSAEDIAVIRESMATGALLTDEQFIIAHKILEVFLTDLDEALVVLNGIPRHEGQARGIADVLDVICVVELSCDEDTVIERIRCDTGGDRAGREDDIPSLVEQKLKVYSQQTRPLIDYYKENGVPVLTADVTLVSTAADMKQEIEQGMARLEL
jgi:adenylate kinase family enzyme